MFWADIAINEIKKRLGDKIEKGEALIIRDEKSMSGRVHVGSMRGAAVHGIIHQILDEQKIPSNFWWEVNDFDPFDTVPDYLDKEKYTPYLGMPLCDVPSPEDGVANYAEFYGREFMSVVEYAGFKPQQYRLSEQYKKGVFNDAIRIALEKAPDIRAIYKKISGSVKPDDWLPLNVICEKCGKVATTKVTSFDGTNVTYTCYKTAVAYTEGCGHTGSVSPFDGRGKLPWKVEWAAKFKIFNVSIEGAGKDHATKGGSREVADTICRDVYGHQPPFDVPYEFILIGGEKMSSSKGKGSSSKDVAELLPPYLFRLFLLGKDVRQQVNFDPAGDTVSQLFDWHDRIAAKYWSDLGDDESRIFGLIFPESDKARGLSKRYLPRFREVAYIAQMPHLSLEQEVERMKGAPLTAADKEEAGHRAMVASTWLKLYAPEEFKFEIKDNLIPDQVRFFNDKQKKALKEVLAYIEAHEKLDGQELHTTLHDIRKASGLEADIFFNALYFSFIGRPQGPKLGWFLSVLPRDFLISRLKEVTEPKE